MDIAKDKDKNELGASARTSEMVFRTAIAGCSTSLLNAAQDKSLEKIQKNPMLLSPVIKCVLEYLSFQDIKNCRLVSQEWGSTGKQVLPRRSLIRFDKSIPGRLPVDFRSCFLDSSPLFSAFEISECHWKSWRIEELAKFFDKQQKSIKELKFAKVCFENPDLKNIDISHWILKSPMVKKDAKYLTKLWIECEFSSDNLYISSLHLIAHIKDVTLSNFRVNLEPGVRIYPIKLTLEDTKLFQDGNKLDRVRVNDFVDFQKAKELTLGCHCQMLGLQDVTKYILDLSGSVNLDFLILDGVEIVNGETSEWVIEHLLTNHIPYSLHREMEIKRLRLANVGTIDLFTLPNSIKELGVFKTNMGDTFVINCSQPLQLKNLETVCVNNYGITYSFLSHFKNCPQLTHLELIAVREIKSVWIPKSVKTLTLETGSMEWVADDCSFLNLEKLVLRRFNCNSAKKLCKAKIRVEELVVYDCDMSVDKDLLEFLEHRRNFSFGKHLYIGELDWYREKLENSVLKERVDVQSPFYVFKNGIKGSSLSEKEFFELAGLPKLISYRDQYDSDKYYCGPDSNSD